MFPDTKRLTEPLNRFSADDNDGQDETFLLVIGNELLFGLRLRSWERLVFFSSQVLPL